MDTRGEIMDCHALPCKARNDGSIFFTQDSRDCGGAVDFHRLQRILGFCDDFVGCRVQSKGAYLVYVTAALRDDSPSKPAKRCKAQPQQVSLEKRAKVESTSETKTESIKGVLQ